MGSSVTSLVLTSGHFLPALTRLGEVSLTLAVTDLGFSGYSSALLSRSPGVRGKLPSSPGFPMFPPSFLSFLQSSEEADDLELYPLRSADSPNCPFTF